MSAYLLRIVSRSVHSDGVGITAETFVIEAASIFGAMDKAKTYSEIFLRENDANYISNMDIERIETK